MTARIRSAFTLVEVLVVMAIIAVLAALVLSIGPFIFEKGARSRAEAEIAAMTAACENYKADNGTYPETANTAALNPNVSSNFDLSQSATSLRYQNASADLYTALAGTGASTTKQYFQFKPNMLNLTAGPAIIDPFGNYYGYSTAHTPTFDLWSTANKKITAVSEQIKWVKNW
jgi:prepilin-type N-terminal cleavage/methylation domain-containing protein